MVNYREWSRLSVRLGVVVIGLFASTMTVACQGVGGELSAETFRSRGAPGDGQSSLPYRLFVPELAHPEQRLPLVLFLHGAGERGTDNRAQLVHGVRSFVSEAAQKSHPCIVVAPQCPRGIYWPQQGKLELCLELLDDLCARLPIDRQRIYVTGLSMGGYGAWHLLAKAPKRFAAAIPICGGGPIDAVEQFRYVPIWAFHGGADPVVAPSKSREMIAALEAIPGKRTYRYTEYPGVRHNSWTRTYANREVHDWLFAQRSAPPRLAKGDRIVFFGDSITEAGVKPGGYVDVVKTNLQKRLPGRQLEFVGAGVSGDRVPDLQERLDADVLDEDPDVVVIYIGINDVWHFGLPEGGTSRADYREGLFDLVARIRQAGDTRILLCTPSVIGERHDGSNPFDEMLDAYSAISREVARVCGIDCVDLRAECLAYLREHNEANADKGILTLDTVHLGVQGNGFVADQIGEALIGSEW